MKIITESMVERHLRMAVCIEAMRTAMIAVSKGDTHLPIRQFMPIENAPGKMAIMPGVIGDPWCFGIKLVCKYVRAPDSPYGTHVGMVLVFDAEHGLPLAMVEGASLTSIRTAAASAMATDILARPDVSNLLIVGCGEQARRHIIAMLAVRNPSSITVWGRDLVKTQDFASGMTAATGRDVCATDDLQSATRKADLICTTTSAKQPILFGDWVSDGAHVNLVGSAIPTTAEADAGLVAKSTFVCDYRPAAHAAAGEFLQAVKSGAVTEDHIAAEIGEIASGAKPGRTSSSDVTVYKSLGVSAQDLAAAHILYRLSESEGFGHDIEMMDL